MKHADILNPFEIHNRLKSAPKPIEAPTPKRFATEWRKDTIPSQATPEDVSVEKSAY